MGEIQDKKKSSEICGAIIGDGWIQSNERGFFLAGDPLEDKDYYDNHISKIFKDIISPVKPKEFPYWKVYGISLYKKELIKKLISLGLPKGKKVNSAFIPRWIMKSNKTIVKAFIRGLFDTDGCIFFQKDYTKYAKDFNKKYHTKARIRISSISFNLIDQIFELFNRLNYRVTKRKIKRGFSNNRNNNDVYILEMNEIKGIDRFFVELQPGNQKHLTKYRVWKKFGFCPPNTTLKQRKEILKNKINPYRLYAGMPERSNGTV